MSDRKNSNQRKTVEHTEEGVNRAKSKAPCPADRPTSPIHEALEELASICLDAARSLPDYDDMTEAHARSIKRLCGDIRKIEWRISKRLHKELLEYLAEKLANWPSPVELALFGEEYMEKTYGEDWEERMYP